MLVDSTSQPQRPDKLRFRNNGRISVINTRRKTSERYSRRIYLDIAFHIPDAVIDDCITRAIDVLLSINQKGHTINRNLFLP